MAKKKKKMTAKQAAEARWTERDDYVDPFEEESEAAFWWRKMGRRGHVGFVGAIIVALLGLWFILGMPGVVVYPIFG